MKMTTTRLLMVAVVAAVVATVGWAATPTSNVPISGMPIATNAIDTAYFPMIQPYPGRFTNDNFRVTASNLFRGRTAATITNVYSQNVYASNLFVTNFYGTIITNVFNNNTNNYFTNLWVTNLTTEEITVLANTYLSNLYVSNITLSNLNFFNQDQFAIWPLSPSVVNIKSGALVTNLIDVGTITVGGIAYTFPPSLQAGSVLVDPGGTGTLEWSDNVAFGPNYWTNISNVLQPTAGTSVVVTNLESAEVMAATGAFIIRNSMSTNLVAGENDINPNNASYILVNGFSSTPSASSVNLSTGNGIGTFLFLVNYTAVGSSFCVYDGTTMWDGGGVLSLPNGDWCPTLPGETLQLLNSGINGWQEVGRFGGGVIPVGSSLWFTNSGSASISPYVAPTLMTINTLGSIGIGETNIFYDKDIGIFHRADTEGNRKAWINIGAADTWPFTAGNYGSEWWANTGTNDAVMTLTWDNFPIGSGIQRDHVWTAGSASSFFYYCTKKNGFETFKLDGETGKGTFYGFNNGVDTSALAVSHGGTNDYAKLNLVSSGVAGDPRNLMVEANGTNLVEVGYSSGLKPAVVLHEPGSGTTTLLGQQGGVGVLTSGSTLNLGGGNGELLVTSTYTSFRNDNGGLQYTYGFLDGVNNSKLAINHTGTNGAVVLDSQSAGTAGPPREFQFKIGGTNAIKIDRGVQRAAISSDQTLDLKAGAAGYDIRVWNNGEEQWEFDPTGNFISLRAGLNNIGVDDNGVVNAPKYIIANNFLGVKNAHTPASSAETNIVGSITFDDNYLYVWTATNVNKRVSLSTW